MIDFNLNNYILVQITEYGWEHLNKTVGKDYVKYCIIPYKETIEIQHKEITNIEEWYKLQAHQVMELFGDVIIYMPIKSNIKIII